MIRPAAPVSEVRFQAQHGLGVEGLLVLVEGQVWRSSLGRYDSAGKSVFCEPNPSHNKSNWMPAARERLARYTASRYG